MVLLMMLLLTLLCTMSAASSLEVVEVAGPEVEVLHGGILDLRSDTGDCDLRMSPNKYPIK